jgi:ATP-dependent helicase/nuclease subunit B
VVCETREAEAILAAHEIRRYVREGRGRRYRDVAVLLRSFEGYHDILSRVFRRYDIPFFLDRRESVAHHPLAELTRYALRTVALGWPPDDWFGALKTGLVPVPEAAVDELENEALSRGWRGARWAQPLGILDDPILERRLERTRRRLIAPFLGLAGALEAMDGRVTGSQLAAALADFWSALRVAQRLERWALKNPAAEPGRSLAAVHQTVWAQMQSWRENLGLAFASHTLTLGEWLPVIESGLSALSVGVIPPALDQVLIGTIDRSRNPDLQMALVLGLNETVFPAPPVGAGLLSESERDWLDTQGVRLASRTRAWLGRERYYGYIACTRARQRLVLACAERDPAGRVLNPSPFLGVVRRIFRELAIERYVPSTDWHESEHVCEVVSPAIRLWAEPAHAAVRDALQSRLSGWAGWERVRELAAYAPDDTLAPVLADALYGPVLRTSVTSLEQFAACPFRFLVHAGLRAKERRRFEIDWRERGSFQHTVLARFHEQLQREGRSWRDLTPAEARDRMAQAAAASADEFGEGLFRATPAGMAEAGQLVSQLQDYVEVAVGWLAHCAFAPAAVELSFGGAADPLSAWELELDARHRLALRGQIDRVDLARNDIGDEGLYLVIDYKSGARKLESLLVEHGLQLQLPAYLAALRVVPGAEGRFGVSRLIPVGAFYVNLRGSYEAGINRQDVLRRATDAKRRAYRHAGRFNADYLRHLDLRPNVTEGDQFNYRLTQSGEIHGRSQEALRPEAFTRLLDQVAEQLRAMGRRIFEGDAAIDPYRRGSEIPCDACDARTVCRIDPWTHAYRDLRRSAEISEGEGQ